MARFMVWLHTEQRAVLEVDVSENPTEAELRDAALAELDKSGGAEWETAAAWEDARRLDEHGPAVSDSPRR